MEGVAAGRVVPAIRDITIGSGRHMRAATLFFDIRGFTARTSEPDVQQLKTTLLMLDSVIPMVMQVIFDHDGYVEKNTGDGVMGIIGAENSDQEAADAALNAAMTIFYVLDAIVNPFLQPLGIAPVQARIGLDLGPLLLARIGLPTGAAEQPRSFLTAVGPAANLASKIQQHFADTNQIVVGDLIKQKTSRPPTDFVNVTPADWTWVHYPERTTPYYIWRFTGVRRQPFTLVDLLELGAIVPRT